MVPPLTRLNLVESNVDGEFTFGEKAMASDAAASFCTWIPVVATAAKVPPLEDMPFPAMPINAKLLPAGLTLLMTQVPLILVCPPVTPVIVTAAPSTSPAVPPAVVMMVTGTVGWWFGSRLLLICAIEPPTVDG